MSYLNLLSTKYPTLILGLLILGVTYVFGWPMESLLFLFVGFSKECDDCCVNQGCEIGNCDNDCDSCSCGKQCGDGNCDGGSCGGSCTGGSCGGSCTGGSCGASCSSCSGNKPTPSTPFLYVWNGHKYIMENDVMFGKPTSRFANLSEGKRRFLSGEVTPDLYIVQEPTVSKEGRIKIQIKEIEPEKSAFNFIQVYKRAKQADSKTFVTSDFKQVVETAKTDLQKQNNLTIEGAEADLSDLKGIKSNLLDRQQKYHEMNSGDKIKLKVKKDSAGTAYILVDSWYRDWTMGEIFADQIMQNNIDYTLSPFRPLSAKSRTTAGALASILGLVGLGSLTVVNSHTDGAVEKTIAQHFSIPRVNADVPSPGGRSFEFFYEKDGELTKFEVIEPRYVKPSVLAVEIPEEAFVSSNEAVITMAATKKHRVSGLAFVEGLEKDVKLGTELHLISAVNETRQSDITKELNRDSSTDFVETLPGDVITLEFAAGDFDSEREELLVSLGGVYSGITQEDQKKAGNWTAHLDDQALGFLREVYQLKS